MVRDRQLICNTKGIYRLFSNRDSVTGTIIANPKGFGFIALDKGGKDLRLTEKQMQLVFHGDKVKARRMNRRGDAEILQVTESVKTLVGRLHKEKKLAYVVIDDRRIKHKISILKLPKKYKNGQIVTVEILKSPTLKKAALGKVLEVLGDYMGEGVETISALHRYLIPVAFSAEALEQNGKIPYEISVSDKKNRVDLTKLKLVTIDGSDSRDFDDAVYAEEIPSGWKIFVAIADVSHYVKEGSKLDKEAFDRGNSVYFPRRVVPMLPEKLSNDLCSLNPKVERLCLTCEMKINKQGELTDYKFYPALMSSYARLTYEKVSKIVEKKDSELRKEYGEVLGNLDSLYDLYKTLKFAKNKRGVIDFDRAESQMIFNEKGKIQKIIAASRNDAHKIIEECMLMANQATAQFLADNKEDFLYRIHPRPTAEKIKSTRKFLQVLGLNLEGDSNPDSKDFSKVLEEAKNRKDENIIKTVVLRTMMQANYTPENEGHFGLAFDNYTHFTSPIRRYPDLLAHRAIKRILIKKKRTTNKGMIETGAHLSMTERRAEDASRDVERWLKCEYMRKNLGETFDGLISGVNSFGLYVELDGVFVEGMISITDLKGDYYIFDETRYQLKGEKNKKIFKLGNPIRVKIASVSLDDRRITLVPAKKGV
jgi:ribonuclease R